MSKRGTHKRVWTGEDVLLYEQYIQACARENFWAFRKWMDPEMIEGWWQMEVAAELQAFYEQWITGQRPVLVLMAPPQHGKSRQVTEFISWASGKHPDLKTIYTSYSDDLGLRANMFLQRTYDNPRYQAVFPGTRINASNVVTMAGRYLRNSYMLEYVGRKGSFMNTTVLGQITGMGLDLGVIDDPIKGRAEAQSKTIRDKAWNWLTDDFFSRFSKDAALLMIMTRWHVDDPVGRLIDRYPRARVLRYPALAVEDEKYRKKGEPLFPEHKPLDFLLERKGLLTQAGWESLYQQNPIIAGGGMFPLNKFDTMEPPAKSEIKKAIRYWDKAATEDGGAYSCGVLMLMLKNGTYCIADVRRGQWSAYDREQRIRQTAEIDKAREYRVVTWIEQEPGSGGKESAENTIKMLRGHPVFADRVTGKKEIRAEPYAAQWQAGNVRAIAADWLQAFLDEHETFPTGKYKDQVDAAGAAFAKLVHGSSYDTTYSWV